MTNKCMDVVGQVKRSLFVTCEMNGKLHSVGLRVKICTICEAYVIVTNARVLKYLECLVLEGSPKRALKKESVHPTTRTSE